MKKISIIGAGAFGFALAKIIGDKHSKKEIFIFDVVKEYIESIKTTGQHPVFHPDTKLADHIVATHSLAEAVDNACLIIMAVPSKFLRQSVRAIKPHLTKETIFLNLAKGLEAGSNKIMSKVINEELKGLKFQTASLSGGMIAREVTLQNPLCAEVACPDIKVAEKIIKIIENNRLRLEATTDLTGVELAGAFKNVIAIGAGIFDGLGYGESSKSAFVSHTAKEMRRLAVALRAKRKTFGPGSQAWFGDLMTTCFGKSRNRELGELIGRGLAVDKALKKMAGEKKSVEGYLTAQAVYNLSQKHQVKAPLAELIYKILYQKMPPKKFIDGFIKRW